MFEIEKMEKEFDYSSVDNETADFLRSCEYEMNGIAADARVRFGGVLAKAQDRLAKKGYGIFKKWVVSGGISVDDAYYYINLNRTSRNLDERKQNNFLKAPKSLQVETMKKNAPEELREKVFNGDITSLKEYRELKEAKELAEKQAEQAKKSEEIALRRLEEEQNKSPKVVEKEVVKEILETDRKYKKQEIRHSDFSSLILRKKPIRKIHFLKTVVLYSVWEKKWQETISLSKGRSKVKILWNSFGEVLVERLIKNLKETKICENCGNRFESNSNNAKYCKSCAIKKRKEQNKIADKKYRNKQKTRK